MLFYYKQNFLFTYMQYILIDYIYLVTDLLIKCILKWYGQCSCLQLLLLELAENVQSRTYKKRSQTCTTILDYLKRGWSILQVYLTVSFSMDSCNSAKKLVFIKCSYFPDDTQTALTKHLLKTVCTDITNLMFNFLASDLMMAVEDPAAITSDVC